MDATLVHMHFNTGMVLDDLEFVGPQALSLRAGKRLSRRFAVAFGKTSFRIG